MKTDCVDMQRGSDAIEGKRSTRNGQHFLHYSTSAGEILWKRVTVDDWRHDHAEEQNPDDDRDRDRNDEHPWFALTPPIAKHDRGKHRKNGDHGVEQCDGKPGLERQLLVTETQRPVRGCADDQG